MDKKDFSPEALLVLEKYCHWINRGIEEEARRFPDFNFSSIDLDNFFDYNSSHIDLDMEVAHHRIIHITADYGDDGGPSHLMAFFLADHNQWELETILHEFDTAYRQIYLRDYGTGKIGFTTQVPEVEEED